MNERRMTFYRRKLPHWHPEGRAIFVTWRIFGSLPIGVVPGMSVWARRRTERNTATPGCVTEENTGRSAGATNKESSGWKFRQADAELDRGASGPLWLRDPKIATLVEDAVLRGDELGHYDLDTYVVMPNHVHVLLCPLIAMAQITGGIKGVSARGSNRLLGRIGQPFWEDESFDHWVRDDGELVRIRAYIKRNPVSAGLVQRAEDWPWSSAAKRGGTT
jgi:REP element-mobilizing transposase RayT